MGQAYDYLKIFEYPILPWVSLAADLPESWNFVCIKFRYDTLQYANDKGADQVVPKSGFLPSGPIFNFDIDELHRF